jgi:hypothetical protein
LYIYRIRSIGIPLDQVLSKTKLAELLVADRIAQIQIERSGKGWEPQLEIEKLLKRIFGMMPIIS